MKSFETPGMLSPDRRETKREKDREFVLLLIKPLGVAHLSDILETLRPHGRIVEAKPILTDEEAVREHYADSEFDKEGKKNYYYESLVHYMSHRYSYVIIMHDNRPSDDRTDSFVNHLKKEVIGPCDPEKSKPGQVRHIVKKKNLRYRQNVFVPHTEERQHVRDNLIHCSDSLESSVREINIWFPELADKYQKKYEIIKNKQEQVQQSAEVAA